MRRVRLKSAHEVPPGDADPVAPVIGKVIPYESRELAVIWPDTDGALRFYQHALLVDVEEPRPVRKGDHVRVSRPCALQWLKWIGRVHILFDDGALVLEAMTPEEGEAGAYVLRDLDGFEHVDGARIVPHPALRCEELRGGHARNPIGACLRCGDDLT